MNKSVLVAMVGFNFLILEYDFQQGWRPDVGYICRDNYHWNFSIYLDMEEKYEKQTGKTMS